MPNKPRTIQKLKANIREEVRALGPEILRKVMENALERKSTSDRSKKWSPFGRYYLQNIM